jgi:hypothetical protein
MVHAKLGDWRGKDVLARDGEKIGKLEDVYVDTESDVEEFGTVKEGLIERAPARPALTRRPQTSTHAAPARADATTASTMRAARAPSAKRGRPSGSSPAIAAYVSATKASKQPV